MNIQKKYSTRSILFTYLFLGMLSLLNGQNSTDNLDRLFFTSNLNGTCECYKNIQLERNGVHHRELYNLMNRAREEKDAKIFVELKEWYNKLDKSFTDCWLGFFTIPQSHFNSVAQEWLKVYQEIEMILKYGDLLKEEYSLTQKINEIDAIVLGIKTQNPSYIQKYKEEYYNQQVFNNSDTWISILITTPYSYYLIDHIDRYEEYVVNKIKKHKPTEQMFYFWVNILLESHKKDVLMSLIENKRGFYIEKGLLNEYNLLMKRIDAYTK